MIRLLSIAALFASLSFVSSSRADDKPPAKSPDSLDEQLLKGLPGDLLEGLDKPTTSKSDTDKPKTDKPAAKPATPDQKADRNKKSDNPVDQELLKALGDGEDIGESNNPLVRIEKQMRTVEQKLAAGKNGGEAEEMQKKIVADLDQLIKQLKQQQKQQKSLSKSPGSGSKRDDIKQPNQPGTGGGDSKQANGPSRDSTDKLHDGKAKEVDMAEMKKLLQNLWGDLPERDRETLLNATGDGFLPKYQFEIEKYFRRLGEQPKKP